MKKFLSLVLALVMTMSLVTISAGAKDFTDNADVKYDEAVQVISLLGVVNGYEDGSFKPTNTLTRGAAAKIICNLLLTPAVADTLPANNTGFKDVPTTNTFAKYIAYCANAGIINGYSDGTFRPAATLTGYAFMKMLLGALGYDAQIEGFLGDTFALNVASKIGELGLADGNDEFVGTKAVTREEACLYAFNMLGCKMVKYASKGTEITVNGVTIIQGASPATETANTFAQVKFAGLKEGTKTDDFGRNYKTWTYKGTTVKLLESKATKVYYGAVTVKKIYSDLKLSKATSYDVTVVGQNVPDTVDDGESFYGWTVTENGKDVAKYFGDLSYMVEVYYTAAKAETKDADGTTVAAQNAKIKIIPVQYQLGVVTKVTKAAGLEARKVSISTTDDGVTGITAKGTYETEDFAKGDVVLFTETTNGIQSVQLAKSVEGKVTEKKTGSITIGSTKYDAPSKFEKALNTEGTFYLSVDNSIIGFNGKEAVTYANYAYVYAVNADANTSDGLSGGSRAYFVKADGTKGNAIVASDNAVAEGNVYPFNINADGEFEIATADANTIASSTAGAFASTTAGKETKKVELNSKNFYMGDDTKFIFVNIANGKLEIATVDGYKNVKNGTMDLFVVGTGTGSAADAKVVFVKGADQISSNDTKFAFLLDADPVSRIEDGKTVYVYSVMIDGNNEATLTATSNTLFENEGIEELDRFSYTLKDGKLDVVAKSDVVAGKTVTKVGNGYLDIATVGLKDLADNCIVYSYDADEEVYNTGVSVVDKDIISYYVNDDGDISMIVITGHADA